MATVQINVRLNKKEKNEFENTDKAIELSSSVALKVFIAKFNHDKGFSYPITANSSFKNVNKFLKMLKKDYRKS